MVPQSVRIKSQMKFVKISFHHMVLFFWHHSENWVFFQTVCFIFSLFSVHFNTLITCMQDFGFGIQVHWPMQWLSFKIFLFNWKWIVDSFYEDLFINFGRTILLPNRDVDNSLEPGKIPGCQRETAWQRENWKTKQNRQQQTKFSRALLKENCGFLFT